MESLYMYLLGYRVAYEELAPSTVSWFNDFTQAIYDKYGYGGGGYGWHQVLTMRAGSDAAALDLFFAELDTFLATYKPISISEAEADVESKPGLS